MGEGRPRSRKVIRSDGPEYSITPPQTNIHADGFE